MNLLTKLIENLPGFNWACTPGSSDWRIHLIATFYGTLAGLLTHYILYLLF
jgi:hypothetical protein